MKKKVFAIIFVLIGAISISPISRAVESGPKTVKLQSKVMYAAQEPEDKKINIAKEAVVETSPQEVSDIDEIEAEDISYKGDDNMVNNNNQAYEEKEVLIEEKEVLIEEIVEKYEEEKPIYSQEALNQSQAKALLESKNAGLEFSYIGDESTFNVLKEKGHEGYVFLPEIQTDIGYFVDKNTTEVYYFHPSGYMDICE